MQLQRGDSPAPNSPTEKPCTKCGQIKPLEEYHDNNRRGRREKKARCKACVSEDNRENHKANPRDRRGYSAQYREENREIVNAKARIRHVANLDEDLHRMRKYAAANKDKLREIDKAYREANPERRAETNRLWRQENPEHCRDYYHQKRARKREVTVEPVSLREIFDRDGGKCQICKRKVRWDLAYPDPMSKSIDHIVPLSRGGTHEPRNCQLAHLRCNVSRGVGMRMPAQMRLIA
jgi:5-methylcytosine-specific restriction endonuclease McrA